jgi:hypothetical protein
MRHHHGLNLFHCITEFGIALSRRQRRFSLEASARDNFADDNAATGGPKRLPRGGMHVRHA